MYAFVFYRIPPDVEEIDCRREAPLDEPHGCGQRIGAVVAGAGENNRALCRTPTVGYLVGGCLGHALHKGARRYGFACKGLALDCADIIVGEKFHIFQSDLSVYKIIKFFFL